MVLAFPSVLTMVFPWPGYILYPLYAHNPILKYKYWKYKYDLINSQKMPSKKSDIHTTLHTQTYFIFSSGYQHGSDRSRMRSTNTLLYVRLWNYAPHTSSTRPSIFAQYSCRGTRAFTCKWENCVLDFGLTTCNTVRYNSYNSSEISSSNRQRNTILYVLHSLGHVWGLK